MVPLYFAHRWWRGVAAPNREPSENLGLPRSGKQERTPVTALVLSKDREAGVSRKSGRTNRESLQVRRPASGRAFQARKLHRPPRGGGQ